jgi:hypothetical protein
MNPRAWLAAENYTLTPIRYTLPLKRLFTQSEARLAG